MLLITGIPRSGTSFTQKFLGFAHSEGHTKYFCPQQAMLDAEYKVKYDEKEKYGAGSLFEDQSITQAILGGKSQDVQSCLHNLNNKWKTWGEPVLKHPLLVATPGYAEFFSCVIINCCPVNERWIKSIKGQTGTEKAAINTYGKIFNATNITSLGKNWLKSSNRFEKICNQKSIPVYSISFGDESQFVNTMNKLGYDPKFTRYYWDENWRGSQYVAN